MILLWGILAGAAMFFKDLIDSLLTETTATYNGKWAGRLDNVDWFLSKFNDTIFFSAVLFPHTLKDRAIVIIPIIIANQYGTQVGCWLGRRYIKGKTNETS